MIPITKPFLTKDEAQAAYDTVLTGWITQGPRVAEFEEKFANYVGAQKAVAVANCTAALHLCMIVSNIGPGDEVICPSMSYIATANCIRYVGATPIFAEVDPKTYNLDIFDVEKRITPRTKAILLVHQMGLPAEIDAFRKLCQTRRIHLIEDAACAVGSEYKGRRIGSHSDLVCFSFHPRKILTTGDGGMISTNNIQLAERLKLLRQHGMSVSDSVRHQAKELIFEDHTELGYNYRMTDIQAAVGIEQLKKLNWMLAERRKFALRYKEALGDIECLRLPEEPKDCISNFQSYSVFLKASAPINRNQLMQILLEQGIATKRGIMTAHRETAYRKLWPEISLPVSEDACDRSILLPLYVTMKEEEFTHVVTSLRRALRA